MSLFPKIQRPCPYKANLAAIMEGDHCTMCQRQVVDLTAMSDAERVALIAGCSDEICVSYRVPVRPALAAAALAASAAALPAYAQDAPQTQPAVAPLTASDVPSTDDMDIFVGGIDDPAHTQFVEDPADATMPTLPVVYEGRVDPKPRKPVRVTVRRKA